MPDDGDALPVAVDDEPTGVVNPTATAASAPAITARLICLVGGQVGAAFSLDGQAATIGRARDAQIMIAGPEISRHHARVSWSEGQFVLEDLSRNGTRLNGAPVTRHRLAPGDRIQIGASAVLVFAEHDDLELRAQRLQKLDAMSQVARELAHDFKNVLLVVLGNAELLEETVRERYPEDEELQRGLAAIQNVAGSAARLANRLLDFARREPAALRVPVELAQVVGDITTMVERKFGSQITMQVELAPGLEVLGSRGELHQVLLNLCLNARDAMPTGGRLTISARKKSLERARALELHLPAGGAFVELTFADTGTGMDAETLARAFEPFYTTKPAGKGTGLGLSSVYGIVRAHGGNVVVESSPGTGTVFRIYLPAVAPSSRDEPTGALRVLVFDPSRERQRQHADVLRSVGYTPIEAGNEVRGVELFREHLHRIAAVMAPSDLSGVVDALREADPGGLVVVIPTHAGRVCTRDELRAALIAAGLPVRR